MKRSVGRRNHAKRRAAERYGIGITNKDLNDVVKLIRCGKAKRSKRLSCGRSIHVVELHRTDFTVIYSNRHKEAVTFLPIERGMRIGV